MKPLDPTKIYYPVTKAEVWHDFDAGAWYGGLLGSGLAFTMGVILGDVFQSPFLRPFGLIIVLLALVPLRSHGRRMARMIDEHFDAGEKTASEVA